MPHPEDSLASHLRPLRQPEPSYGKKLREFWAPLGTIVVIISAVCTIAWRFAGPAKAKADDILELKIEVRDLQEGQHWTMGVLGKIAAEKGIQVEPIPTPHPVPDPFATPSSP